MRTLLGIHRTTIAQDLALLVARLGIGVVLIAHGWQKVDSQGFEATAAGFDGMGIPLPEAAAGYAIAVELGAGVLLVLGLLTRLAGVLVVGDMLGALWFAHRDAGVFVADGGWELVAMIGALALVVAAVGAGRISLDRLVTGGLTQYEDVVPASAPASSASRAEPDRLTR